MGPYLGVGGEFMRASRKRLRKLGAVGTALEGYFKIDKRKLEFVKLNVVYTVCGLLMITVYNY